MSIVFTVFFLSLPAACSAIKQQIKTPNTSSLAMGGGLDCPNKVRTFGDNSNAFVTKGSAFYEESPAIKFTITPDEFQEGQVKCTITNCTVTVFRPVVLSGTLPLLVGQAGISLTYDNKTEQGANQGVPTVKTDHHVHTQASITPLNLGNLVSVGIQVQSDYTKHNGPDNENHKNRSFACEGAFVCHFPGIDVKAGATNDGLKFEVNLTPTCAVPQSTTKVSSQVAHYEGHIKYRDIPKTVILGIMNGVKYTFSTKSSLAPGQHADPFWDEWINHCHNPGVQPASSTGTMTVTSHPIETN